jgi:hypothetical protein
VLEAAGKGYLAPDHRFLHAILDRPQEAILDLVRFASEDRTDDPVDLDPQLIDLFRHFRTAESIPFLLQVVRKNREDISDEIIESLVALGPAVIEPLLGLLAELGDDAGEIPFTLAVMRMPDSRILDALIKRLDTDVFDAAICLEVYGDAAALPALRAAAENHPEYQGSIAILEKRVNVPVAPEPPDPFDIWEFYPKEDSPDLGELDDDEAIAMLDSGIAARQIDVARYFASNELPLPIRARLLNLAKSSPHAKVRGASWEALQDVADEPEIHRRMLAILDDPAAAIEEKGSVAVALASESDNPKVFHAIEELYRDPRSRVSGLKAMARSLDRRFSDYPPKHLDDPDPELRRQAIWGVGFLNLSGEAPRLEPFFSDPDYRADALFAYALSGPGETSRPLIRSLLAKIEDLAGGFQDDEEEVIQMALDQRLILHGKKPVFFTEDPDAEEAVPLVLPSGKVGRNDPCPCGSGKKYKKCCGA